MKKLVFISSLSVALMFVVTSCSKDDPAPASGSTVATFPISYNVVGAPNSPSSPATINSSVTANLADILTSSGNQDKVKYVSGSVIGTASSIIFSGITGTGATLSNITFSTDDNTIKNVVLNDSFSKQSLVVSKDTTLTMGDANYLNFLGQIGTYLASKKSIKLNASYTINNQPITAGKITLNVSTTFGW